MRLSFFRKGEVGDDSTRLFSRGQDLVLFLGLLIALTFPGCKERVDQVSETPVRPSSGGINTPRALLDTLRSSLANTNEDLFLRCFHDAESHRDCLREVFRKT